MSSIRNTLKAFLLVVMLAVAFAARTFPGAEVTGMARALLDEGEEVGAGRCRAVPVAQARASSTLNLKPPSFKL